MKIDVSTIFESTSKIYFSQLKFLSRNNLQFLGLRIYIFIIKNYNFKRFSEIFK